MPRPYPPGRPRPESRERIAYELHTLGDPQLCRDDVHAVQSVLGRPLEAPAAARDRGGATPLVVIAPNPRRAADVLGELRSRPESALRPVAVIGAAGGNRRPGVTERMADRVLEARSDSDALEQLRDHLLRLSAAVRELSPPGDDLPMLMLQYLYSRQAELPPLLDPGAPFAYRYPLAECVLGADSAAALDVLDDLAEHGLLGGRPADRVFVCPECGDYRVPVKERCTECHSPSVRMEDSIHHFRCGYVGPEREFIGGGRAVCPKCRDPLRHIGVEYNRPGRIVSCEECGQWASEPELRAWCASCNLYHAPEDLRTVRVRRYSLTRNGARAARDGRWGHYQAEYLSPEPERRRNAAAGRGGEQHEAMRLLLSIALENHWPIVVYKADLYDRSGEPLPPRDPNGVVDRVENSLRETLGKQDLVVRLGRDNLLILATRSRKHRPLQAPELERRLAKQLPVRLQVTELIPSAALNLLSTGP